MQGILQQCDRQPCIPVMVQASVICIWIHMQSLGIQPQFHSPVRSIWPLKLLSCVLRKSMLTLTPPSLCSSSGIIVACCRDVWKLVDNVRITTSTITNKRTNKKRCQSFIGWRKILIKYVIHSLNIKYLLLCSSFCIPTDVVHSPHLGVYGSQTQWVAQWSKPWPNLVIHSD